PPRPRQPPPHRAPQRRARAETNDTGMAPPALGRRGLPLLAEPQPRPPDPLVEETREPPRLAPTRLRPDRVQEGPRRPTRSRPTGIGPKNPVDHRVRALFPSRYWRGSCAASSISLMPPFGGAVVAGD